MTHPHAATPGGAPQVALPPGVLDGGPDGAVYRALAALGCPVRQQDVIAVLSSGKPLAQATVDAGLTLLVRRGVATEFVRDGANWIELTGPVRDADAPPAAEGASHARSAGSAPQTPMPLGQRRSGRPWCAARTAGPMPTASSAGSAARPSPPRRPARTAGRP